jgi:hypothetical protein
VDFTLIFISLGLMAVAFAGIAIKLLIKKGGEFAGTCASRNPILSDGEVCGLCGAKSGEACASQEKKV